MTKINDNDETLYWRATEKTPVRICPTGVLGNSALYYSQGSVVVRSHFYHDTAQLIADHYELISTKEQERTLRETVESFRKWRLGVGPGKTIVTPTSNRCWRAEA